MILTGEDILQSQGCRILGFCGLPYFSIPNGAYKNFHAQLRFAATGLMAGVPDICVPRAYVGKDEHGYEVLKHGLFIEFKNGKNGKISPKQREWMERLQKEGYGVYIVRELPDLYKLVIECYPEESKRIHNINKLLLENNTYGKYANQGRQRQGTYRKYKRGF